MTTSESETEVSRSAEPMSARATQAKAQSNPYLSAILIKKTLVYSVFFRSPAEMRALRAVDIFMVLAVFFYRNSS